MGKEAAKAKWCDFTETTQVEYRTGTQHFVLLKRRCWNVEKYVGNSRRQLVPFFRTISILDKSPKVSTTKSR